ncbi:hypothetical protein [Streptomyces sp. KR80]|uniref:hypothetical protein n=1 Tax=Streptomyces sp. KR80 TaxID=3457426 RepID=UPI003FD21565
MTSRSTQARRLGLELTETTGVRVELRYDSGTRWFAEWTDGPTKEQMRELLAAALAGPCYPDLRDRTLTTTRHHSAAPGPPAPSTPAGTAC